MPSAAMLVLFSPEGNLLAVAWIPWSLVWLVGLLLLVPLVAAGLAVAGREILRQRRAAAKVVS